jgi:hypothetical protein
VRFVRREDVLARLDEWLEGPRASIVAGPTADGRQGRDELGITEIDSFDSIFLSMLAAPRVNRERSCPDRAALLRSRRR